MWGCAENNDTKQGEVNIKNRHKRPIIPWNIEFHNKPKYPWRPTFKHSLIWPSMKKLLNLPLFYRNTYFLWALH